MNIEWRLKAWDELSKEELYSILRLRAEVFVVEQNCPYQDIDNKDMQSIHLLGIDHNLQCVAYLRLVQPGVSYKEWSIGRVITSTDVRRTGVGRYMMLKAIDYLITSCGSSAIRISAQSYLEKFYSSLGFVTVSEPYLEDDIPHVEMLYTVG